MKEKIKNLYNKKSVKITFRILTVLVYLFTFIMILLLTLGSCSYGIKDNNVIQKEKPIPNILKRDNYYMMAASESSSIEGLYSIQYWCNNINTYYKGFASGNSGDNLYYNLLQTNPNNVSDNMDNVFYISQVGSSGRPTTIFNARRIHFFSTIINQTNSRRWYYRIDFGNDGNNEAYALEWNIFTDITNSSQVNNRTAHIYNCNLVHFDSSGQYHYLDTTDYAFTFMEGSTLSQLFFAYINDDSEIDYNNGFNFGFEEGYKNGFNDGQEDLSINGASPFLLLKQGADAIASLLDIKLLPFLSLGTLMFTPIVIALIIVIIKMVKG